MKAAIMQPHFLPYIGYWQLINAVDTFVVYDNIKYTKKGWINRNRYLQGGRDKLFSINLQKGSDFLNINERLISPAYDRGKLLDAFRNAYRKAPMFLATFPLIEAIINFGSDNLFDYIFNSIAEICRHLSIGAKIVKSSQVGIDHGLKSEERVIAICKKLGARAYVNPMGGAGLYSKENFADNNIALEFLKPRKVCYKQFNNGFIESLSILDVLMFNNREAICQMLNEYELL